MERLKLLCLNFKVYDWPEGYDSVEVDGDSGYFFNEEKAGRGKFHYFRNLTLEYGQLEGESVFSKEQFEAYHAENPDLVKDFEEGRRDALARLAEISQTIGDYMNEGSNLSEEYGIDWIIETDRGTINVGLLNGIEWDSSSLHC